MRNKYEGKPVLSVQSIQVKTIQGGQNNILEIKVADIFLFVGQI